MSSIENEQITVEKCVYLRDKLVTGIPVKFVEYIITQLVPQFGWEKVMIFFHRIYQFCSVSHYADFVLTPNAPNKKRKISQVSQISQDVEESKI